RRSRRFGRVPVRLRRLDRGFGGRSWEHRTLAFAFGLWSSGFLRRIGQRRRDIRLLGYCGRFGLRPRRLTGRALLTPPLPPPLDICGRRRDGGIGERFPIERHLRIAAF